jgi:hypothetical protein
MGAEGDILNFRRRLGNLGSRCSELSGRRNGVDPATGVIANDADQPTTAAVVGAATTTFTKR